VASGHSRTQIESAPHPILVIHLAHELQLEDLLPAAFYDLSRYGPRKIVSGAMTWQPLSSQQTTSTSSKEPVRVTLSNQELYIALLGRETGQRYLAVMADFAESRSISSCSTSYAQSVVSLVDAMLIPCSPSSRRWKCCRVPIFPMALGNVG